MIVTTGNLNSRMNSGGPIMVGRGYTFSVSSAHKKNGSELEDHGFTVGTGQKPQLPSISLAFIFSTSSGVFALICNACTPPSIASSSFKIP